METQSKITEHLPPKPTNWQLMTCSIESKDFMHPHPEFEKLCERKGHDHVFKGWGEVYIVCVYCRMKCGMCMD